MASLTLAKLEAMSAAMKGVRDSKNKQIRLIRQGSSLLTGLSHVRHELSPFGASAAPVSLPGSASNLVGNLSALRSASSAPPMSSFNQLPIKLEQRASSVLCETGDLAKAVLRPQQPVNLGQHELNNVLLDDVLAPNSITQLGRSVCPGMNLEKMRIAQPQLAVVPSCMNTNLPLVASLPRVTRVAGRQAVAAPVYSNTKVLTDKPAFGEVTRPSANTQQMLTTPHSPSITPGEAPSAPVGVTSQSLLPSVSTPGAQLCIPQGKQITACTRPVRPAVPCPKDQLQQMWKMMPAVTTQTLVTDQRKQVREQLFDLSQMNLPAM